MGGVGGVDPLLLRAWGGDSDQGKHSVSNFQSTGGGGGG